MIQYATGNLLDDDAHALVNPVNTVGVMGKGLALQFKKKYPANFEHYKAACVRGEVKTGQMFVTSFWITGPKWIVNFPTKQHWMYKSELIWITQGLKDLKSLIREQGIPSIAIPALGVGLGGLDWVSVNKEIQLAFKDLHTDIRVYVPQGT